jgi:hypothetical protein
VRSSRTRIALRSDSHQSNSSVTGGGVQVVIGLWDAVEAFLEANPDIAEAHNAAHTLQRHRQTGNKRAYPKGSRCDAVTRTRRVGSHQGSLRDGRISWVQFGGHTMNEQCRTTDRGQPGRDGLSKREW